MRSDLHTQEEKRLYTIWVAMRSRCSNQNDARFKRYGKRGIQVCRRWNSFDAFIADMGPRPHGYTLERRRNSGNYTPSNCVWATKREQMENTRRTRRLMHRGRAQSITAWAREIGVKPGTLAYRLDVMKLSVRTALEWPLWAHV